MLHLKVSKAPCVSLGSFVYFYWRFHKSLSHSEQTHVSEGWIREISGCKGPLLSNYCLGSCLQLCIQTPASSSHQVSSSLSAEICLQNKCSVQGCASPKSFLFDMDHTAARALVQRPHSGSVISRAV